MALEKKLADFNSALSRLQESIKHAEANIETSEYSFFRDSTIQRFEFTLEIGWKSIKEFLLEHEGIECLSPKGCMRDFFNTGYVDEQQVSLLLQMIDDRNLATHTYHESIANDIFSHIHRYVSLLSAIYDNLQQNK